MISCHASPVALLKNMQGLNFRGIWMTNSATLLVNTPEEQHKSLDERPEVIMLGDGTFSILFNCNVPKQLVKEKNPKKPTPETTL